MVYKTLKINVVPNIGIKFYVLYMEGQNLKILSKNI